jgi:uncharacterized repeat protein (TIGR01451 family)
VAGQIARAGSGGTQIENTATATYSAPNGQIFGTQSNTTSVAVVNVSALVVTPKEAAANPSTDTFPTGITIVKTFTISNDSDISDAYVITALTSGAGRIVSAVFVVPGGTNVPITVGSTVSPAVAPGGSIQVAVNIDTTGIAVGTSFAIALTARTTAGGTANGPQKDSGEQWAIAAAGAKFQNPANPALPIAKLVNGQPSVAALPGSTVTFSASFQNGGGAPATSLTFTDTLPNGLAVALSTVQVNGANVTATLAGQTLRVALPNLASGATDTVSFNAVVSNSLPAGIVLTNVVSIAATNAQSQTSSPVTVISGSDNIVFDGQQGGSSPIAGATVTLADPATLQPVRITGANPGTINPFTTGNGGAYAFSLGQSQFGGGAHAYVLLIIAPSYLNRRIALRLVPNASGTLYTVTATALDGLPLAAPGGFSLISQPTSLGPLYGTFGNIPMFRTGALRVTKQADRSIATAGDRIVYTLNAQNTTQAPLAPVVVSDVLPAGLAYAHGTGTVNGNPVEPVVTNQTLVWKLASLAAASSAVVTYAAVLLPQVPAQTQLENVVTVTANGQSSTASATVQVVGGIFGSCTPITGRVYADANGHRMVRGDAGVPGVRIILEDGNSAVTDRNGRFSFECVHPGQHVLRLDETTIPEGWRAFAGRYPYDDRRSTMQLVHGLFDAGMLDDVNFALQPVRQ